MIKKGYISNMIHHQIYINNNKYLIHEARMTILPGYVVRDMSVISNAYILLMDLVNADILFG